MFVHEHWESKDNNQEDRLDPARDDLDPDEEVVDKNKSQMKMKNTKVRRPNALVQFARTKRTNRFFAIT